MGLRLLAAHQKACLGAIRSRSVGSNTSSNRITSKHKLQPASPEMAKEIEDSYSKLDLTFENTKEAFKSKSNSDVLRALLVLRLCGINLLVQNNQRILAAMRAFLGKTLFKRTLKSTFYGHFVAGETKTEVEPVVVRLKQFGVKSILDYSVESDLSSEEAATKTVEGGVDAEIAPAVGSAITDTGVVDSATLESTRERYAVHKEFADRREDVVSARTYFYEGEKVCDQNRDIFIDSVDAVAQATGGEGFAAIKITALGRPALLLKLSGSYWYGSDSNVSFKRGKFPEKIKSLWLVLLVCDYTKSKLSIIRYSSTIFMYQERKRAATIGYEDPVNPNFEATSRNYEACLTRIADEHERREKGSVSVMIASHNEDTVRFAVNLMKERAIAPSERIMCFAQLYGMCDQVSFSLGQAGYSVYKYLPYGPVEDVLPYLSRRALENGSVLKKANKERDLLWTELKRRIASGQFLYKIIDFDYAPVYQKTGAYTYSERKLGTVRGGNFHC
uniref:Proline dehydrogenase n=1 Tax=Heterorhabditis bacteriophora TaxID=37862 RepID=A0A1I7XDT0_HETBA